MVSFQLESDAEVSSRSRFNFIGVGFAAMVCMSRTWTRTCSVFRINIVAVDRMLPRVLGLDTFLFENNLVVEFLWPRRERRARMITVVFSNIFDILSKSCNQKLLVSIFEQTLSRWRVCRGFSDWLVFS